MKQQPNDAVESERSLFVVKNTQRRQRQINEIHFRSGVVRARMHELLARSCNPNQRNVPLSPWRRQQSVAPQVAPPTTVYQRQFLIGEHHTNLTLDKRKSTSSFEDEK